MYKSALLIGLLLLVSSVQSAPNGQLLYEQHCSGCHRYLGEGGIGLPLNGSKMRRLTDEYLVKTIRYGRPGKIMPSFQDLSDAQVNAIVTHIRDWTGHATVTYSSDPVIGDTKAGGELFKHHCAVCHGLDGRGEGVGTGVTLSRERSFMVMPPAISNSGFLASASDKMIKETIVNGRSKTAMPSFAKILDDKQVNDVVSFVRSFQTAEPVERPTPGLYPTYIIESSYDFEETLENLQNAVTGANFRTFPQRFLEQGLTDEFSHNQRQVTVRFCNFKKLYKLINTEPRLGIVLPCRITVIEKEGKVLLIAPNMLLLSALFNNDELREQAQLMDEMVQEILDEATL